jgi:hypothetical protein
MSKLANLEDYRKIKEMRTKYFEEDYPELDGLTLKDLEEELTAEDEELLQKIGIPMVEFEGSTLKE